MRPRILAAGVALAAHLVTGTPAAAQSYRIYGAEQFFTVESSVGERRGRPVVFGYVVNRYGITAQRVRLLVESVDATGQPTETTIAYVSGDVPPGPRVYFEVVVPRAAATYRVHVLSWDWKQGHS